MQEEYDGVFERFPSAFFSRLTFALSLFNLPCILGIHQIFI